LCGWWCLSCWARLPDQSASLFKEIGATWQIDSLFKSDPRTRGLMIVKLKQWNAFNGRCLSIVENGCDIVDLLTWNHSTFVLVSGVYTALVFSA
jgi:hypothetical protein